MEFIQQCFAENRTAFTRKLKYAGFSMQMAEQFLPSTAECIFPAPTTAEMTRAILELISTNPAQVLHSIDVDALASKLGISPEQASYGLVMIEPLLADIMANKKDAIVRLLISQAWDTDGNLSTVGKRIFH